MKDTRDNKTYKVRKLADGKIWMAENLKLSSVEISSADSNLPSNKTVHIPTSSTSGWCTNNDATCDNKLLVLDSGKASYGYYYNWYTATATYGQYGTTSASVLYDICPKVWRLPTGGSSGEFQALYNQYGSSASMRNTTSGPGFVLSGARDGGNTIYQDSNSYYWSSTAYNGTYAYRMYLNSSEVAPADKANKYLGFPVRCLAK